jgi:hypothetical protein
MLNEILFNRRPRETLTISILTKPSSKSKLHWYFNELQRPLTVQFTDTGTNNPTNWLWSSGDGHFSTKQNPVHKYDMAGKCTVTLTVRNYGDIDAKES